jgi:hypothetical protein
MRSNEGEREGGNKYDDDDERREERGGQRTHTNSRTYTQLVQQVMMINE